VLSSSAKVRNGRQGRWRENRDGEFREPLSNVQSPAAAPYDENAALRVGRTLFVKGDVTAAEDLLIRGRVIGSIHVHGHVLTIGRGGNISGEIVAEKLVVQGHVAGGIEVHEQLVINPGGMVVGDVEAPSVIIREGGTLRHSPEGQALDTGGETAQAQTASRARGRKVDKDGVEQDPALPFDPRERIAEGGRGSRTGSLIPA
jgi:cytoskeletal protein CcmA (bactofilin family)